MSALTDFRQEIDRLMRDPTYSPLEDADRRDFTGLRYYEPNDDLAFEVAVERLPADEPLIQMGTSTGDTQTFRRWGRFTFVVDGEEATLTIFSDRHGHEFFVPFRDATNGDETYGAGRYLDDNRPGLTPLGGDRFAIDFNYAYNPYCAYTEAFSCPLPPRENWVKVPIRAGEKAFRT